MCDLEPFSEIRSHIFTYICMSILRSFIDFERTHNSASEYATVPLDLNFTHPRAQKATARNIHGNAPE